MVAAAAAQGGCGVPTIVPGTWSRPAHTRKSAPHNRVFSFCVVRMIGRQAHNFQVFVLYRAGICSKSRAYHLFDTIVQWLTKRLFLINGWLGLIGVGLGLGTFQIFEMPYNVLDEDSSFVNRTEYTISEHTYTQKLLWASPARAAGNKKSQGRGELKKTRWDGHGLGGIRFSRNRRPCARIIRADKLRICNLMQMLQSAVDFWCPNRHFVQGNVR